jgi:tol-pal system protein YbgF
VIVTKRAPVLRAFAAGVAALFAGSLLASCTLQERDAVADQGNQLNRLQAQMLRLERSLEEVRSAPAAESLPPEMRQRLADLGQQVESLGVEVRGLAGRFDALETVERRPPEEVSRVPQIEARLLALADRVAELETQAATSPAPPEMKHPPPPPAPPPPSPGQGKPAPQDLYDQAYALYKQGRYIDAREAFRKYAELYPDTNLTDNAYFWIGESYYEEEQFEQAILEYDKVVQSFPDGDKVPSALLKQAFAFDAIDGTLDAKILLKKIIREHPGSQQAEIAKKKLEILED